MISPVSKGADRYSIAYFCHPQDDVALLPVPSEIITSKSNGVKANGESVLTAAQHLEERLAATYGWEVKD